MSTRIGSRSGDGVIAVLGPTNTGKTHLAVERMLGHRTGIIGLPLRLLAREIYDKVVAVKGARAVALITGEEKIVPRHPSYFICTAEAMPLDRRADFVAVDEIQLCADPERGHIFTARLLQARGERETMFLGADTVRPVIRALLPKAEYISRPRFSRLSYSGERKIARLPRRSAVVAFSAADVYALAELLRRHRGGAAVVMGALSPRTRNAQVALYQSGEVDYLVATDAVGMGLNMNVDHVAFSSLRKFDGVSMRMLNAAEMGQIAGRAGRHLNDGTFGTTAGLGTLDAERVEAVENHRFDPIRHIQWRNSALEFSSLSTLLRSLDMTPPRPELIRTRDADDAVALQVMAADPEITKHVVSRAAVRRLWDVCQIPDFRKTMAEAHHRLLKRIYSHLMSPDEALPTDWVATQVDRLDRTDGDIDTLSTRIAHIRTWTYISNRPDWVADAPHWQERTRAIEDQLSDALHTALTKRFVDRRTAVLVRGLNERRDLFAAVTHDGDVLVEGQFVGRLRGLRFTLDSAASGPEHRAIRTAANRVLAREVSNAAARLAQASANEITWSDDNRLWWEGAPVAQLAAGPSRLKPAVALLPADHLSGPLREQARRRLAHWIESEIERVMQPLHRLTQAAFEGIARGLVFQLCETGGSLARQEVDPILATLTKADRQKLRHLGVRLGYVDVFLPALLKPERQQMRGRLWAAQQEPDAMPIPPAPGLVSVMLEPDQSTVFLDACGFRAIGGRAVRVDMLDRLAETAQQNCVDGLFKPDHTTLSIVGCGRDEIGGILAALGYCQADDGAHYRYVGRKRRPSSRQREPSASKASPFAVLRRHAAGPGD